MLFHSIFSLAVTCKYKQYQGLSNYSGKMNIKKMVCMDFNFCTKINVSSNSFFHEFFEAPWDSQQLVKY